MQSRQARIKAVFIRVAVVAALSVVALGSAQAAPPFFSGQSIAKQGVSMTLSGGNFEPNAAVTIMVRAPNGQEAGYSAVVGSDGKLSYQITPSDAGEHRVAVTSSSGKELARATFHAAR